MNSNNVIILVNDYSIPLEGREDTASGSDTIHSYPRGSWCDFIETTDIESEERVEGKCRRGQRRREADFQRREPQCVGRQKLRPSKAFQSSRSGKCKLGVISARADNSEQGLDFRE